MAKLLRTGKLTARRCLGWGGLAASCFAACAPDARDGQGIGVSEQEIRFGTAVSNPAGTAHVNIWLGAKVVNGSGTLLSDKWALTAAHVLDKSRCRYAGGMKGNAVTDPCTFLPSTHFVGHGNYSMFGNLPAELNVADRVSVHPSFTQNDDLTSDTGVDVALIHTSKAFAITGNPSFQFPSISTSESGFLGAPVCLEEFGYGPSQTNPANCGDLIDKASAGTLMKAEFKAVTSTNVNWFETVASPSCSTPNAKTASGDSGGGVFLGNSLVGIHRAGPANCAAGPGEAVRASKFVKWANLVMSSIADVNFLFTLDLTPDSAFLRQSGSNYELVVLDGATDVATTVFSVPVSLIGAITSVALSAGRFNGDSFGDAIFQLNGKAYALNGGSGLFGSSALTPSEPGTQYEKFHVGDFDGDGFDDVEAVRSSGWVDVLYGSSTGLKAGRDTVQLPSDDRNDGWFYAVTGSNEITWPQPESRYVLYVTDPTAEVRVEIFDGRNGSGYDRYDQPYSASCFRFYGYPKDDGSAPDPARLIATIQGDALKAGAPIFPENEWGTLYQGLNDTKGLIPNTTNHQYLVRVTHANCAGTNSSLGINSFKVRASPEMLYAPVDFSFHPRDAFNDILPGGVGVGSYPSTFDTEYSATFVPMLMNVKGVAKLALTDTDADRIDDPSFPGLESVANKLFYELLDYTDPNLAVLATNTKTSGNWWAPISDFGSYDRVFCLEPPKPGETCFATLASHPDFLVWVWRDVIPSNVVRVSRKGSYVLMSSRPPPIPRVTTAEPASAWLSGGQPVVAPYLPLVLGELNPCGTPVGSSVVVNSAYDAVRILEGKAGPTYGGAKVVRDFRSALLAAKLSVARALASGEALSSAYIYGSDVTVGDAIAQADAALARHCLGASCDGAKGCALGGPVIPPQEGLNLAGLATALGLIEAINGNELTYHP